MTCGSLNNNTKFHFFCSSACLYDSITYFNESLILFLLLSQKQVQVSYLGLSEAGCITSVKAGRDIYL